jgi:hypothetical protein
MIYWIKAGDTGAVKVGYAARDVPARVRLLQTGCPWPLILMRTEPGERDLEAALHRHYRPKHLRAEWFALTEQDVAVDLSSVFASTLSRPAGFGALLLTPVEAYLHQANISASVFGLKAVGDSNFVRNLRAGREPRSRVVAKVTAFMEQNEPQTAARPNERQPAPAEVAA